MNFTQIVTEVVAMTQRPDMVSQIRREVNNAINFCCLEANFARDLAEDLFDIDPEATAQSLPLSTFPRWRKFAYIKAPASKHYISNRAPAKVFENNTEALDVYYVVGSDVKFKLCKPSPSLIIGYFTYPPTLTDAVPDFWLLEVSPYMIMHKAAASIFSQVGNTTETTKHEGLFATMFESARRDYKYGANYG